MPDTDLTWMSLLLVLGHLRARLEMVAQGTATPAQRLAAGLALADEAATLTAVLGVMADEVSDETARVKLLEARCAELSDTRRKRRERVTRSTRADLLREAVRCLPYSWREAVMDWVRQPYVGGPIGRLRASSAPGIGDLDSRFASLVADATALTARADHINQSLRLPPVGAFLERRQAALADVPAACAELSRLSARAAAQLTSRFNHLRHLGAYLENLEYIVARIDPEHHRPRARPRPLPDLPPDRLRVLTRRLVPQPVRTAVMDWVLP